VIDPSVGVGGPIVATCLFVVTLAAVVLHICSRRFLLVSFGIALTSFLFWFALWIWLDVLDQDSGSRMWNSLPMVVAGFWLPLIFAATIGLPFFLVRHVRARNLKDPWDD
jgi:hypothetical protein